MKQIFHYEPAISELIGKLIAKEVKEEFCQYAECNDTHIRIWVLKLPSPIAVHNRETDLQEGDTNFTQQGITELQLVITGHYR